MISGDQIVAHLVGDYLLQSHWMATQKTRSSFAAAAHAVAYTLPFALLTSSVVCLAAIFASHFVLDRWRIARFVVWFKNGARGPVTATGYADDVPPWLAVWLFVAADNTLHLLCNGVAIAWLGSKP